MVHKMEELNFKEVDALDRNRTLFFLAVSPLEEHGPHLPLGVDFFNAVAFSEEVARHFSERHTDWHVVIAPPLALGSNCIDLPGSINVRQRVVRDLVVDYGTSLARHGFRYIVVFNAHAGAGHIVALEEAAAIVSRRHRVRMISPTGRLAIRFLLGEFIASCNEHLPQPLTPVELAELKQDFHAGCWETSMMLKVRPDLVKKEYISLEPRVRHKWEIMMNSVEASGRDAGYLGHPSKARVEFAEASARVLTDQLLKVVDKLITGEKLGRDVHSYFYFVPFYKTDFWNNLALTAGALASIFGLVFLWRRSESPP